MAEVLAEHVHDLPDIAKNFLNWRYIESDWETGLIIIFWGDGEEEEIELHSSNSELAI